MCDFPTIGIFASHETRRSWIIFKETKTEKGTANMQEKSPNKDPDLENMHMLLDEELRPATPDLTNPISVELFEEHKRLAQEFLKVQTEIVFQSQKCDRLRALQSDEKQKQRQSIDQLQSEKEGLILLKESLQKQKQTIRKVAGNQRPTSSEWVILSAHDGDS